MHNRPYGFDVYKVNIKTIRTIVHIFVAFSEKLNFTELPKLFTHFNDHTFAFLTLHLKSTLDMCPLISQHIIFSCSVWSHLNWEKSKFLSSLLARGKINIRRRWNVINKLEKIGCSLEMNLLPFANSYKIKISTY